MLAASRQRPVACLNRSAGVRRQCCVTIEMMDELRSEPAAPAVLQPSRWRRTHRLTGSLPMGHSRPLGSRDRRSIRPSLSAHFGVAGVARASSHLATVRGPTITPPDEEYRAPKNSVTFSSHFPRDSPFALKVKVWSGEKVTVASSVRHSPMLGQAVRASPVRR